MGGAYCRGECAGAGNSPRSCFGSPRPSRVRSPGVRLRLVEGLHMPDGIPSGSSLDTTHLVHRAGMAAAREPRDGLCVTAPARRALVPVHRAL